MTLDSLQSDWRDIPEYHQSIHDLFCTLTNQSLPLKSHRDWVEENAFGFGERSFHYMWKVLLDELGEKPVLCELGVFRGQVLSLWRLLKPNAQIFGITPLDSSDGHWESDYAADIKRIHNEFGLKQPVILKGRSDDARVIEEVSKREYDVIYVDGGHSYDCAYVDLVTYSPMVKVGGYLVIDDCNNEMSMPWGFFQGIQSVTDAKLSWLKEQTNFEFVFSVVHVSIFRRVK